LGTSESDRGPVGQNNMEPPKSRVKEDHVSGSLHWKVL